MIDRVNEDVHGSDFMIKTPVGVVVNSVDEVAPAIYDRIGYAGTTEPVEAPEVEQSGFDPIGQGV